MYTWTKGIAAGAYLIPALLVIFGVLSPASELWRWAVPLMAGAGLGATGVFLLADLDQPTRFYMIFTKHQWESWLVRGAMIITAYGAVLGLHFLAALLGNEQLLKILPYVGAPLAVATAVYTAYLFAQAKARDFWQNPLLPPHLAVQALLAGAAVITVYVAVRNPGAVHFFSILLAMASAAHLLFVFGEITLPHATAHAAAAAHEMVAGRYWGFFWIGVAGAAAGVAAPWIGVAGAPIALIGLLAHEHAHVQAGQSVPLA